MADLFEKGYSFNRDTEAIVWGIYPYFKPISRLHGPHVTVDGRDMIMMGSNNYLGLTTHPKVREAAKKAIETYGSACTGTRYLNGALELHEELERELARFMGKPAALVFEAGYLTNQGIIAPLIGRDDVVLMDRLVHASIIEGARLGMGRVRRFQHNDADSLRKNLERCSNNGGVLVVIDGVYSMDGDLAPLPDLLRVAKEFGARFLVDDAHGIGVIGEGGRGVLELHHLTDEVDLVMGTFSKSFASLGGFVAGDEAVISYIKHNSAGLKFAAPMTPSSAAAVMAAVEVIETEPEIRENLWRNTRFFLDGIRALKFETGETETPVVPIIIGDDIRTAVFWKRLAEDGVFTNCVLAPGVPEGTQRIRTTLMATHTIEDLEKVLEVFGRIGKELGIIN